MNKKLKTDHVFRVLATNVPEENIFQPIKNVSIYFLKFWVLIGTSKYGKQIIKKNCDEIQ